MLHANEIRVPRSRLKLPCRSDVLKPVIGINTYLHNFRCRFCNKKIPPEVLFYSGGHGIKICEKCIRVKTGVSIKSLKSEIKGK